MTLLASVVFILDDLCQAVDIIESAYACHLSIPHGSSCFFNNEIDISQPLLNRVTANYYNMSLNKECSSNKIKHTQA